MTATDISLFALKRHYYLALILFTKNVDIVVVYMWCKFFLQSSLALIHFIKNIKSIVVVIRNVESIVAVHK